MESTPSCAGSQDKFNRVQPVRTKDLKPPFEMARPRHMGHESERPPARIPAGRVDMEVLPRPLLDENELTESPQVGSQVRVRATFGGQGEPDFCSPVTMPHRDVGGQAVRGDPSGDVGEERRDRAHRKSSRE